jgi:hypothetical protein
MKKNALLNGLVCAVPLIVLPVSFSVMAGLGRPDIFGVGGLVRYSWVMWFFLPVLFFPIFWGVRCKKHFTPYKRYFVVSIISILLVLVFGSFRFAFSDMIDYSTDSISYIEGFADVYIPDDVKMVTEHMENVQGFDPYYISYILLTDPAQVSTFEREVQRDTRWVEQLPTSVKGLLPSFHQMEIEPFDYFLFYNLTTDTYNTFPTSDYNNCIFIAYDSQRQCLYVIHDLVVRPVF